MKETQIKEHPILFSGPMVRAILEERKTQTRRVIKPQPFDPKKDYGSYFREKPEQWSCPYGQPGDRLWVRETWYIDDLAFWRPIPLKEPDDFDNRSLYYRADGECCKQIPECACAEVGPPPWRPSIHMPRWISRITLEVISVRVERLQEITTEDAIAEGFDCNTYREWYDTEEGHHLQRLHALAQYHGEPIAAFGFGWDRINAKRGFDWNKNPWVWVVEFKKREDQ